MTMPTPVRAWDLDIPLKSLPNGMPLGGVRTALAQSSIETLDSARVRPTWEGKTRVLVDQGGDLTTSYEIIPDASYPQDMFLPDVEWIDVPGLITFQLPDAPDPRTNVQLAESFRTELDLKAAEMGKLLSMSRRSFYDFTKKDEEESLQAADIRDRLKLLIGMAYQDTLATLSMIRGDVEGVSTLLEAGRFDLLRSRYEEARTRRVIAPLASAPRRTLQDIPPATIEILRNLVAHTGLPDMLETLSWLSPDLSAERLVATEAVSRNVEAAHDGDPVDEEWRFLVTLTHDDMDEVGARALSVIRSAAFSWDRWETFIREESIAAWSQAGITLMPADEPDEPLDVEETWEPDLARFGASLRLSDYERRG
jgi:hypothetical protein